MGEHRYVHSFEKDDVELNRLSLQANVYDPTSIRHLETIRILEGWKCLEVGAGAGSVAQWLSQRVGSTGKVVATDIDIRFLNRISAPNLEVRKHDILKDDLEKGEYDIVHCRMLLMHLPDPEKGLRRMADAVRPGGWLLIEEHDLGSSLSADVNDDPSAIFLTTIIRAGLDWLRKKVSGDPYFGRRVRGLVEQLGFSDVGQEGYTYMLRGGDPMSQVLVADARTSSKLLIAEGLFTQDQFETYINLLQDPTFYHPGYTLFCAWGRKPVQRGGT